MRWVLTVLMAAAMVASADVLDGGFGAEAKGASRKPAAEESPTAKPKEKKSAGTKKSSVKGYPFHGEIGKVDAGGGVIELKGKTRQRRIVVTGETRVTRDGAGVLLAQARVGEGVSGTVFRREDGAEQAITLRLKGEVSQ